MPKNRIVLDTNIFVGAGFNKASHSAALIDAVREGQLILVWNEATRQETEKVVTQIPPLNWPDFAPLFDEGEPFDGKTHEDQFPHVEDPADRKFAALADAAGAILVSNDDHLLNTRRQAAVRIYTPGEFMARWKGGTE
jgi:predicted nucleic acid-binding protein